MLNGLLCESAGIPANPANGLALGACVVCELSIDGGVFAVTGVEALGVEATGLAVAGAAKN